jgi:hypothetical protein
VKGGGGTVDEKEKEWSGERLGTGRWEVGMTGGGVKGRKGRE